jgi:ABC-type sugar transport system permease subunit
LGLNGFEILLIDVVFRNASAEMFVVVVAVVVAVAVVAVVAAVVAQVPWRGRPIRQRIVPPPRGVRRR